MKDTLGRNINYLRVSITDLCNLRCKYCMPEDGIQKTTHNEILSLEEIIKIVKASVELGVNKVRLTGGEPLVRKGIIYLVEEIAKLSGVQDLAITTNGLLLQEYAQELKGAGLNRVNISLDSMKEERYKQITRGGSLRKVLDGIEAAKKAQLMPIKINTVIIGGFNDDEIENFAKLTMEGIDVRFIELMPIGQAAKWSKENFLSNNLVMNKIKDLEQVFTEDKSSPAKYYKLPGAKGKIGFINPISNHFCKNCNRIRLTADGRLKPCLHSNQEIDIKSILREEKKDLKDTIKNAILAKPHKHHIMEKNFEPIARDMVRIGG